jgi:plastocyanin
MALSLAALPGCPGCDSATPPAPTPPAPAPAPPAAQAPAPSSGKWDPAAGFGTIKGRVLVSYPVTPPAAVKVDVNADVCGPTHDPASLLVQGGALEGCVVYLKGPDAPADWDKSGTFVMDQKTCHYVPRVLIVPVGGTVTFTSSDPVLHNVKSPYKAFNKGVSQGAKQPLLCDEPGFAELQCNVHTFMAGLLVVAENPWYALTDAKGEFKLTKVPVGTWKIYAQHEVLGKSVKQGTPITVTKDGDVTIDLPFEKK